MKQLLEMKLVNVLIAIAILINYSSARPTRSLGENENFPVKIKVLNEDGLKYGNDLSIQCAAESDDITEIKWVRESSKNRATFSDVNEKTTLMTIYGIIPMDFGKYICIATNSDGVEVKNSIRIERNPNYGNRFRYRIDDELKADVPKPEQIIGINENKKDKEDEKKNDDDDESSHNLLGSISDQTDVRIDQDFQTYTYEGETVTFTCLINDANVPDVAWTRNHGKMPRNSRVINNILIVTNVTAMDTGYYICSYGDKSTYVYLGLVRRDYPVTYVRIPSKAKQINVVEGDSVDMDCEVVGSLETNLKWQKHQDELPEGHVIQGNRLRLNSVKIENYGYYECLGENALGNFSDFVYLDVKNRTEMSARQKTTTAPEPTEEIDETTSEQNEETTTPTELDDGDVSNETTTLQDDSQSSEETTNEVQPTVQLTTEVVSTTAANQEEESVISTTEASQDALSTVVVSTEEVQTTESVVPQETTTEVASVNTEPAELVATTTQPVEIVLTTTEQADVVSSTTQPADDETVSVETTTQQVQVEESSSTEPVSTEEQTSPIQDEVPVSESTTTPPDSISE